jgi:magnesium chelatase family protein
VGQAGEISLAYHGVILLNEFRAFTRGEIEVMRQPLEEGSVTMG